MITQYSLPRGLTRGSQASGRDSHINSPFVNTGKMNIKEQPEVTSFIEPPEANRGIKGSKLRVFSQESKGVNAKKERKTVPLLGAVRQ